MKILLFIISITTFTFCSVAQSIDGIPLKDLPVEFVQIVGVAETHSSRPRIAIDYGQHEKYYDYMKKENMTLKDEDGNPLVFYSMIAALNFMTANGFSFVSDNGVSMDAAGVLHYQILLKKGYY